MSLAAQPVKGSTCVVDLLAIKATEVVPGSGRASQGEPFPPNMFDLATGSAVTKVGVRIADLWPPTRWERDASSAT